MVCQQRPTKDPPAPATYANVEGLLRPSHGDIVTAVGADRLTVVGGNVSNSAKHREVLLDSRGLVSPAQKNHDLFFAIVKVR